jgi:hypothetical protein
MFVGLAQPITEISTNNLPEGVKSGQRVRLETSPPSIIDAFWDFIPFVVRLYRRYERLDVSHPYRPARAVAVISIT